MEQEVYLIDSLVDMPVTAVPMFIVETALDGIQPLLGGIIYTVLIDHGQECFPRDVFVRAGVRQDSVDNKAAFFKFAPTVLLDFVGWLLVWPPTIVVDQAIELVHTVGSAQHKMGLAIQREDLSILSKEQVRVCGGYAGGLQP